MTTELTMQLIQVCNLPFYHGAFYFYCILFFILVFSLEEMERNPQHTRGVFTCLEVETYRDWCSVKAIGDQRLNHR